MISPVSGRKRQKPKRNREEGPALVNQLPTDSRLPGPELSDQAVVLAFLNDAIAHLANAFDRLARLGPTLGEIQQALEAYVTGTGERGR